MDHLRPLKGRHWTGKWEPGDLLLWLLKLPDDAEDIDGNPISTRVSCGLNIPINLWPLEASRNSAKSNRKPAPNVFAWTTPIEAQEVRAAGPGEWSPGDGYED